MRTHARQIANVCRTLARHAVEEKRAWHGPSESGPVLARFARQDDKAQTRLNFEDPLERSRGAASGGLAVASAGTGPTQGARLSVVTRQDGQRVSAQASGPVAVETSPDARRSPQIHPALHASVVDANLPAFPAVTLPELAPQFDIEGRWLDSNATAGQTAALDVLLRRDYAELRLQKGFDELLSTAAVQGVALLVPA